MYKIIISIILILILNSLGYSQVTKIKIDVDGFTCSLCAKGVEGQFKSLNFVKSVKTNLQDASFELFFRLNKNIDIDRIKEAVTDGGFSVGKVEVVARGKIIKNETSYLLKTGNSPDITLANLGADVLENDEVLITGNVNPDNTVSVSSVKKI